MQTFQKVLKIIVGGDGGVGKTTLLKQFCYDQYCDDQTLTVGNEIFVKKAKIEEHPLFLQIWDLGGQDRFRFMLSEFLKGAAGAIIAFDVKRRKSFLDLKEWIQMFRETNDELPILLIATKKDLGYHPTLNEDIAKSLVEEYGLITFVEISSKDNLNVDLPFKVLLKHLMDCNEEKIDFVN